MKQRLFFVLALALVVFVAGPAAAVDIFPLDDLQVGMRGHGLTVIRGFNVETFFVEIMDLIPQSPPTPPLIMVRVSGDVIERSGGIASGMSGSPVYVDNKLLGAIGYGYRLTDHRIGLVTPIEPMLAVLDTLPTVGMEAMELPPGFLPLQTPLLLGGFSSRSQALLAAGFDHLDVSLQAATLGTAALANAPPLEPGSAFGVQLLRGDFQAAAIGTVTFVENGQFVGFGHPFTHRGEVGFFVTPASVHYTMPQLEFPFKIASTGPTIGTLLQDRAAGVGGVLDRQPPFLNVVMRITDEERSLSKDYTVDAVWDISLVESLVISSAYEAVDATLDRVGAGTAYVRLEFQGDQLPHRVIRDNMFFSDSDIAVWTLVDLMEGLNLFVHNSVQEVKLSHVVVDISVASERRTAAIEKATPRNFQVKPGDSVEVEVQIRPYRAEVESRILRMVIPEDTLPGTLTVTVRAGGSDYFVGKPPIHTTFADVENGDEPMRLVPTGGESLDKLIEQFVNRERNSEIVLEYYPFLDTFPVAEEVNGDGVEVPPELLPEDGSPLSSGLRPMIDFDGFGGYAWEWNGSNHEPIRVRLDTSYVMDGIASFDLEVGK